MAYYTHKLIRLLDFVRCLAYVYTGILWGNLRERYRLEDPGVDGRIILRWIFRKWDAEA